MKPVHFLLAILVMAIWGFNFLFVRIGLHDIPPLMLCTLRFLFSSIPAIFFIKIPKVPLKWLIFYGFMTFGLQFALLFLGMKAGVPAGLASLLAQIQVFFSIFLATIFLQETLNIWQIIGALVAFSGIGVVTAHIGGQISLLGLVLIIGAAASWGVGNLASKKIGRTTNVISLVVWGSFFALIPLLPCTMYFEGMEQVVNSLHQISKLSIFSVFYIVYISTWVGYGAWNWLLGIYPMATIAPFTLLVPVFGLLGAVLILDEPMEPWKTLASILIIFGLFINSLGPRLRSLLVVQT